MSTLYIRVININVCYFFFIISFQLVMFMQDLQGEPKGLSIGGLVVITKSLSLTVNLLLYSSYVFT